LSLAEYAYTETRSCHNILNPKIKYHRSFLALCGIDWVADFEKWLSLSLISAIISFQPYVPYNVHLI